MATTTIPWGDGSGDNIYLTYSSASGDQTVEVSSDANTGSARSQTITFSALGISPVVLTVNQDAGMITPVFYSRLVFDGVAYIDTDIYPEDNSTYRVSLGFETLESEQRVFSIGGGTGYIGVNHSSGTNASNRAISIYYKSTSALSTQYLSRVYGGYNFLLTPKRFGWGDTTYTFAKGSGLPSNALVIGSNGSHNGNPYTGVIGVFRIYDSSAQDATSDSDLGNNYTPYFTLRPCKYAGVSGLWNVEEGKFYGNSAGSGSLIAANYFSGTLTSYDSRHSYYSLQSVSNAYAGYSSTSRCNLVLTRGSGAESYIYFKFDTSSISQNATIIGVFCTATAAISSTNTSIINEATIQMCSGTTLKGTATNITATSRTVHRVVPGTWTRQELENAWLKFYAKRGTSSVNSNHNIYIYGATMYILYTD